jgi:hypothetical protein
MAGRFALAAVGVEMVGSVGGARPADTTAQSASTAMGK